MSNLTYTNYRTGKVKTLRVSQTTATLVILLALVAMATLFGVIVWGITGASFFRSWLAGVATFAVAVIFKPRIND